MARTRFITINKGKDINLLPEKYKVELRRKKLSVLAVIFSCALLLVSALLFFILQEQNQRLKEISTGYNELLGSARYDTADELYEDIIGLREEIAKINEMLDKINDPGMVTRENLEDIFKLLPLGVLVQTVSLDAAAGRIVFSGVSDTRENVSAFAEILSACGKYDSVALSALTTNNDGSVRFTLVFMIRDNKSDI